MNSQGDTAVAWKPENAEETAVAEKAFQEHMTQGRSAYEVVSGRGNELIREFKPDAEEIVVFNRLQGG